MIRQLSITAFSTAPRLTRLGCALRTSRRFAATLFTENSPAVFHRRSVSTN